MTMHAALRRKFPLLNWQTRVDLAPYTYMKVGGPADVLWVAEDLDSLVAVVQFVQSQKWPFLIVGGASNIILPDAGVRGLVIINQCDNVYPVHTNQGEREFPPEIQHEFTPGWGYLIAETGIKTALLVRASLDEGLTGLEAFIGVPGTLGGAVYNNSHRTAAQLIGNHIIGVEVLTAAGQRQWLTAPQCDFAYDHSRFHTSQEIILRVLFKLKPGNNEKSLALIREYTQYRAATQPIGTANSGCVFKNASVPPEKKSQYADKQVLSAGWLIDQAGLKGRQVGGAIVSNKHANFIVNDGTATTQDIKQLVGEIQNAVWQKFGIELHPEVFFIDENAKKEQNA